MAAEFRPVAPVDPTNLRPMLFLDVARQMMLSPDWSHRAATVVLESHTGPGRFTFYGANRPQNIEDVHARRVDVSILNPAAMLTMAHRGTGAFTSPRDVATIAVLPHDDRLAFAVASGLGFKSLHPQHQLDGRIRPGARLGHLRGDEVRGRGAVRGAAGRGGAARHPGRPHRAGGGFRTDFLDSSSLRTTRRVIEDYAATAGQVRRHVSARRGAQPNDPVQGAAAIMRIATVADPPERLQLGADSVAAVEGKLRRVRDELEQWRELAVSATRQDDARS